MRVSAHIKAQNGVTLIEMMLVVGLIAVMTGALIPGFSNYTKNQALRQSQEQLKNDLSSALNNSLTGVLAGDSSVQYWGIKVPQNAASETATYDYFTAANTNNCNLVTTRKTSTQLPNGTVVKASNVCIYFSKTNGDVVVKSGGTTRALPYTIKVGYPGETASCSTVVVNSAGQIKAPGTIVSCL